MHAGGGNACLCKSYQARTRCRSDRACRRRRAAVRLMGEAERAERGVTVGGKRPAWSGLVWSGTQPTTYPPRGGDEGAGGRTPFLFVACRLGGRVEMGGFSQQRRDLGGIFLVSFFGLDGPGWAGLDCYSGELVRMYYHHYYCCR
jgi:hypothetical protein